MVGRLPSGAAIDQVTARADVISGRLETDYPETNRDHRFVLTPLGEGRGLRIETRPVLRLLASAVLMVLLVACVNVASLLLARAVSREREVALRIAIGASRARLVRQWLTEAVLLGILGSIGALLVARVTTPLLHAFVIPEAVDLSVNARVFGFTLIVGVGSGLLFGLAPVLQTLRPQKTAALRDRGPVESAVHASRIRGAFVILQIAVSFVLLVGAGLFFRTLENAYSVDMGYRVDQILVGTLNLEAHGYFEGGSRGADAGLAVYEQILSRVEALPGVVAAGAARMTVLSGNARFTDVSTDGRPIESHNALGVRVNVVSRRYFETMNIPILQGRPFNTSDGPHTTRVTIVSKSLAERIWPNEDPIGKRMNVNIGRAQGGMNVEIVGVVADITMTQLDAEIRPATYIPNTQLPIGLMTFVVRTSLEPTSLTSSVAAAVRQVDPALPLADVATMTERLRRPNYGTLEVELTIDDQKTYTRPWTVKMTQAIQLDTELIDEICLENEKSWQRMQSGEVPRSLGGRAN